MESFLKLSFQSIGEKHRGGCHMGTFLAPRLRATEQAMFELKSLMAKTPKSRIFWSAFPFLTPQSEQPPCVYRVKNRDTGKALVE